MILYKLSTAHHFSESKARVRLCYLDAELSNKSIVFHWMHSNKFVSKVQFSRKRDSNPWEHHTISGLSGKKFVQRCERLQFQLNIWTSAIRDVSICWSLTVCYCGKHCWTNAGGKLFREIGVTMLNITMKWFMGQIVSLFRAQDHSIIIRLFILVSFSCIRQVNSPLKSQESFVCGNSYVWELPIKQMYFWPLSLYRCVTELMSVLYVNLMLHRLWTKTAHKKCVFCVVFTQFAVLLSALLMVKRQKVSFFNEPLSNWKMNANDGHRLACMWELGN